jgi:hypothetical protein
VLDVCKEAINEKTDIHFDYEIHGKSGKKASTLKFTIAKKRGFKDPMEGLLNLDYIDMEEIGYVETVSVQLSLEDTQDTQAAHDTHDTDDAHNSLITALVNACNNEFDSKQIQTLYNTVTIHSPHHAKDERTCRNYIAYVFNLMETYSPTPKNRLGYMLKIIKNEEKKTMPPEIKSNRYARYAELENLVKTGKTEEARALRRELRLEIDY